MVLVEHVQRSDAPRGRRPQRNQGGRTCRGSPRESKMESWQWWWEPEPEEEKCTENDADWQSAGRVLPYQGTHGRRRTYMTCTCSENTSACMRDTWVITCLRGNEESGEGVLSTPYTVTACPCPPPQVMLTPAYGQQSTIKHFVNKKNNNELH